MTTIHNLLIVSQDNFHCLNFCNSWYWMSTLPDGVQVIKKFGLSKRNVIPVLMKMHAATINTITTHSAIILTIRGNSQFWENHTTKQINRSYYKISHYLKMNIDNGLSWGWNGLRLFVGAGFPIQGSRAQNHWVAPRSTLPLSFQVDQISSGITGDLVIKSKLSPRSGSVALRQFSPIHKKGP